MKFTLEDLKATKAGQLQSNAGVLGAVETKVAKPNKRSEIENSELVRGQQGLAFRIRLIVVSRRRMDAHDNLRSACKPVVDAITESLGFKSDDDPALEWNYSQISGRTDRND